MGKVTRRTAIMMAEALQKTVAMYGLLIEQSQNETDLSEDQIATVVEGVAAEARDALVEARRVGLIGPVPMPRSVRRAHRDYLPAPHSTVQ